VVIARSCTGEQDTGVGRPGATLRECSLRMPEQQAMCSLERKEVPVALC